MLTTIALRQGGPAVCNQWLEMSVYLERCGLGKVLMSLQKLARELDETARQTAAMADAVSEALDTLADRNLSSDFARAEAIAMIVSALQGQDRIEQRCQNMALAVRQFALLPPTAPDAVYDEIWSSLILDELRVPSLSGVAAKPSRGEVELF